ncbi:MAG: NAD(P)/FAD-dependent oxidoreductase [Acidimicrobiales bacterium]
MDDRTRWQEAVDIANIPTLLMVLVHLTGDRRWLHEPYRPTRTRGLDDNDTGGLPDDVQDEIRAAAYEAIVAWDEGQPVAIDAPSPALLIEMMEACVGQDVPEAYAPIIANELRLFERPPEPLDPPPGFEVLVVGAGISGICAGVRLAAAGIPYTILERNDAVGGTWLENHYPGCGVDTPSYLYSFSFARADWSKYFSLRDELHAYVSKVAADFDITDRILFGTEVVSATWDEGDQHWQVVARGPDGETTVHTAAVVISAVGAFNKPKIPDLPGSDSFAGPSAHTARWPGEGIDLEGKRVAVIGTGASAMQLVPAMADTAESVTVFQRTAQWAAPFEKFHQEIPAPIRHLLATVPLYHDWYRIRLAWAFNDVLYPALQKDPDWDGDGRSIGPVNDRHRAFYTDYIVAELGDRQDLLDQVLPDYPPYGKRMLMDNGWFRTMTRDDVRLVTEAAVEIRPHGVVTRDGTEHEAEVLVWATGFDVVNFLAPMEIVGRDGVAIREVWGPDDARAYLGTAIPGAPNFFCLYGPNAQFGHGGSLITIMERQMHYVMSLLRQLFDQGLGSVEVRQEVHDTYNERVDATHEGLVWTDPGMENYYRNSKGRVVAINPFRIVEFWALTEEADLGDYRTEPAATPAPIAG